MGALCLLCDLGKGFLPVFWAKETLPLHPMFAMVIAAPVLGHALAPLYPGKRGKAISVSFGVLLGLVPQSPLVWVLASLYLFFSLVLVLRPNERRTVMVYTLFSLIALLGAVFTHRWPYAWGGVLVSLIVAGRNLPDAQLFSKKQREGKPEGKLRGRRV